MTARQRYLETILFGKPDRVPLSPGGPRESTLAAWHQQGLPEDKDYWTALSEILGIHDDSGDQQACLGGQADSVPYVDVGVSFQMIPTFEEKVLEHKDGHYIVRDWMGAITEISDQYDYTYLREAKDFVTRKWHRFPVQNRQDWEAMKWRYGAQSPGRFPEDFEERCRILSQRDYVAGIYISGPFWQLREWCGMEGLCLLMTDDPDLVQDMVGFWTEFVSQTMAPILERVELDEVVFLEDMAFKQHSMISPEMTRRFLLPAYQRWIGKIRESGCPIVHVDSDGYIGQLIPLWIEVGVNCCSPVEVAAGNDIVSYRSSFGRQMAYQGGIDKRAIARGGEIMTAEVMRVVPPLMKEGGFIPSCDHGVPPDISWSNFVEYTRLLAQLTCWL